MNLLSGGQKKLFLNKYLQKRLLGKGAFATVYLVECNGELHALKLIDKKKMEKEGEDMLQYLVGEISCMKEMQEEHLVKLEEFTEDENFFYIVLEYCDEGDLLNLQMQQPEKVFPLQMALQLMSQVILGLKALHSRGYVHRDIKPQNVLIKNVDKQKIAKIADFGFTKKATNLLGTILGTEFFISPQIYEQCSGHEESSVYGSEVDVWAFGVLLFYMLNSAYPFNINPYWSIEEKASELKKQAQSFSYKQKVGKTRKKILANCTDQVQGLFQRIFQIDRAMRITFSQMQSHSAFESYFQTHPNSISTLSSIVTGKKQDYSQIKLILSLQLEQIGFLTEVTEQIEKVSTVIGSPQCLMLNFHLTKYFIILSNNYAERLSSSTYLKPYSGLNWKDYFSSKDFDSTKQLLEQSIKNSQSTYQNYSKECSQKLLQLCELNIHFEKAFSAQKLQADFSKSFSYTLNLVYRRIKQYLKTNKFIQYYRLLCLICLCYVFDNLYNKQELKISIFQQFLAQEKQMLPKFSYLRFMKFLRHSQKSFCINLAKKLLAIV